MLECSFSSNVDWNSAKAMAKIKNRCVYCNMSGGKWVGRSGFFFSTAHFRCHYAPPAQILCL